MSKIFYYSNYCNNCKKVLGEIVKICDKKDIHFICIDNRVKKSDGSINIILQNNQEMLLPPTVDKVPALLLLNHGNSVIFGDEILSKFKNNKPTVQEQKRFLEPEAFSFGGYASYGVSSDNFSFLDQSADELSAKGDGGLRQLRNNATVNYVDTIETPPDDYAPNKVGNVSMEELQNKRANEIKSK